MTFPVAKYQQDKITVFPPLSSFDKRDVSFNYIRKPKDVRWGYTVGNLGQYIYNDTEFNTTSLAVGDITAQTSFKAIDWHYCDSTNWKEHIPEDYKLLAIETAEPSFDLYKTELPENCVFFVGNEKVGIDDCLLKECEKSIYIPMKGHNKSMNVSHALTIVLGEWTRQNYY